MPPIDRRPAPKRKRYGAVGRGADTTAQPPASGKNVVTAKERVKPSRGTAFTRPGATRPFQRQRQEAQRKVDVARRGLPAPAVASPPVVSGGTRGQAEAARQQIVRSVRQQTAGLRGRERQAEQARLLREIRTDPRLRAQRMALDHVRRAAPIGPQTRGELRAGPPPRRAVVGPASINLTALGRSLAQATPGLQSGTAEAQFVRNALKDVGLIGSLPVVAGVALGGVAKDVVTGHPGRAAEKTKDFATGVARGTVEDWSNPGEYFRKHPLLFALDLGGATSVVGRGAGAAARAAGSQASAGGVRGALARAGSTVRPPLALSDDAGVPPVERAYSRNAIRKSLQVGADSMREPLRRPDGSVVTVKQRGREVPVLKATEPERWHHAKQEADFAASRANNVERMVRDKAHKEMKVRGVKGRGTRDLVAMVVEGTITSAAHWADDLRVEAARIADKLAEEAAQPKSVYRHTGERKAAEARLKLVREAQSNPKVVGQRAAIVKAGEEVGRKLNTREREAIGLGLLHEGRALRSRLSTSALAHLGARYWREDELRALERTGVPVREPQALQRHEAAQQGVRDASAQVKVHERELEALRHQRSRVVGAQAVKRGQEAQHGPVSAFYVGGRRFATREAADAHVKANGGSVRKVALTAAEARRTGEVARLDRAIANRRRELQAARKARHVANRKARKSPKPPIREALRGPDGRFLANKDIEDFLKSRGRDPETVAYLPHRLDTRGARAFHTQFRAGTRPVMDNGPVRTGAAYAKGVTESSANLIREQGVRQATQIEKARQIDRMITDQGLKHPDGRYFTPKEAAEVAERLYEDSGRVMVPVRAFGAKLSEDTQRIIREDLQGPGAMESLGQFLLNDRILHKGVPGDKGARNVVLVDARYIDRLNKHLRPAGDIQKFFQMVNRPFRFAVLAQPRWLTGNFVEPFVVRLTASGSGLNVFGLGLDVAAATRMLRRMERSGDPRAVQAAKELHAQQLGGLMIGQRGLSVRRSSDELVMGQLVSRLPVVSQGFDLVRMLGRGLMVPGDLFFRANRIIENVAQRAALGRQARRDMQEFTGSWAATVRLQASALDEVAQGLINTPTQRRFMRMQHELLGKYEGFSPTMRMFTQTVTPFVPWMLNAARFVFWTMPAHHSALTAVLTRTGNVMAKDWEEIHSNVPPGGLKYAIPTKDGGWLDLARYTPYGLSTPIVGSGGKNVESITDQFLPQASGAVAAIFHGEDPFGRPLRIDPSENEGRAEPDLLQRVGIGAYGLAEAMIPYVSQTRRVLEGGKTAYAGSTIFDRDTKPGTAHGRSGLSRTFNPLSPTYLGVEGGGEDVPPGGVPAGAPAGTPAVPASVQRALQRVAAAQGSGPAIPPSVQRALARIQHP